MIFGSDTEILVCARTGLDEPVLEGFGVPVIGAAQRASATCSLTRLARYEGVDPAVR
ncbi:hypothetical protein L3i22_013230 [Actinoplanes sp. L3-i22]|nr:hypothetical protein L3i22_013230 [Actinoplanes sp. L3-i22]